jgi:hypothetical protein
MSARSEAQKRRRERERRVVSVPLVYRDAKRVLGVLNYELAVGHYTARYRRSMTEARAAIQMALEGFR